MFEFELNDKLIVEQRKVLEQALSTNPKTQKALQKLIQQVLKDAREQVVAATKGALDSDPRGAAQSIRRVVYKKLLGANLNILNMRRRAGNPTNYEPPRKLDLIRTSEVATECHAAAEPTLCCTTAHTIEAGFCA